MRRHTAIAILLAVAACGPLGLSGCSHVATITWATPTVTTGPERLARAWVARNAAKSALATVRATGAFTRSQAAEIDRVMDCLDLALGRWEVALKSGSLIDQAQRERAAAAALGELQARQAAAARASPPEPTTRPSGG